MMSRYNSLVSLLFGLVMLNSCSVFYPSIMLRTKRGYPYVKTDTIIGTEYKIAPNDIISVRVFSNDGFKLIEISGISGNAQGGYANSFTGTPYLVESDGLVKLPILGRKKMAGMTIRQAEMYLEDVYAASYIKPFVLLSVSNSRVIIFPGGGNDAKVLPLTNSNTTLLEALASSGGVSGKSRRIKVIRGDPKNPDVYLINLSTIEGMKEANMVLQTNDIIYVEPVYALHRTILAEINAYLALVNTFFLIYALTK